MISFKEKGDFSDTRNCLLKMKKNINGKILEKYAKRGVDALSKATPKNSGLTSSSWYYEISDKEGYSKAIYFKNSNIVKGVNIAIILDAGHATRGGAWVHGYNYIDPAIQPIFEKIAEDIWKEVSWHG